MVCGSTLNILYMPFSRLIIICTNSDISSFAGRLRYLFILASNSPHDGHDCRLLVGFHLQTRRFHAPDVWIDPSLLYRDHRA